MLMNRIKNRESGILTYGITPPKAGLEEERVREIAARQIERIRELEIDALILYDIQEEKERVADARPFPFMKTLDPDYYSRTYLTELTMPHIIYRCVGKYHPTELENWMAASQEKPVFTVFVGAASALQQVTLSLAQAYQMASRHHQSLVLGGVVIPERHSTKADEHRRVMDKMAQGCSYFVSQAVYNVEACKNFLSDYYYSCMKEEANMAPVILTLTPCGSLKTLTFMKWLGVSIPRWLENELKHSADILERSIHLSREAFMELKAFGEEKGIPIGCNVESVSINRVEIEASLQLARDIKKLMGD